jgi:hypothetical protein
LRDTIERRDLCRGVSQFGQCALDAQREQRSCFGGQHALRGPHEQVHADAFLEVPHSDTNRRLSDSELLGDRGHVVLFRQRNECLQS